METQSNNRTEDDLNLVLPFILNIKFFNEELEEGVKLTSEDFKHICETLKFKHYHAGDIIMRKGDYGSTFYVILSGTV